MYQYNKPRNRPSVPTKDSQGQLFGPNFSLNVAATAVSERPGGGPSALGPPINRQASIPNKDLTSTLLTSNVYGRNIRQITNSNDLVPGDRVIFAESPSVPGVPIVYRTSDERAANPDRLNLDRRRLTVCPILEGEEQLRLLNYQHNTIKKIQHLSSLRRLIFLDLYDNQIDEIIGLTSLKSLRVLMLGKNKIDKIANLDSLSKLDVLDLHGNRISVIENLTHLLELRVLNLAGNQITTVENLGGMNALAELNLRRNKINNVVDIDNLPSLQRLFLSFNDIGSFEDILCLAESPSLTEIALDGNPFCQDSYYKQTVLRHMPHLKQLDMKRVTEEERRIAHVYQKRDEEKRREMSKSAINKEKRRLAINNAKRQWETMQGSLMARTNKLVRMPELYATHIGSYKNEDSGVSSRSSPQDGHEEELERETSLSDRPPSGSSRPTSAKSLQNGHAGAGVGVGALPRQSRKDRPPTTNRQTSRSLSRSSYGREKETVTFSSLTGGGVNDCHLAELDGDTLCLYGSQSLEALERNWGIQAAGAVTTLTFRFIDFNDLARQLHKIRTRFPSVQNLNFISTNIKSFNQINALTNVRRLDSLSISDEGNPITSCTLWRMYTIFRLSHFNLKKLNDVEVTDADGLMAEKLFGGLTQLMVSTLPQARLLTLLGDCRKKQIMAITEDKRSKSPDSKFLSDKMGTESVGKGGLQYAGGKTDNQDIKAKEKEFVKTYISDLSKEATVVDRKMSSLRQVWPQILTEMVYSAVIDMQDRKTYMKQCMDDFEKG